MAAIFMALLVQAPFTLLASRLVFDPEVRIRDVLGASIRALPRVFALRNGSRFSPSPPGSSSSSCRASGSA